MTIWDLKNIKRKFLNQSLPTYFGLLCFYLFPFFGLYNGIQSFYKESGKLDYSIVSKKNNESTEFEYYNQDSIKLLYSKTYEIIPRKIVNDKVQVQTKVKVTKNRYVVTIGSIILIILISIRAYTLINEDIRDSHWKKILKILD